MNVTAHIAEEQQDTFYIECTYQGIPFAFTFHKTTGWLIDVEHSWHYDVYSCPFCQKTHSYLCEAVIIESHELGLFLEEVLVHPSIRLHIVTKSPASLDVPVFGYSTYNDEEEWVYEDVKTIQQRLDVLIQSFQQEGKKISGIWSDAMRALSDVYDLSCQRELPHRYTGKAKDFYFFDVQIDTWYPEEGFQREDAMTYYDQMVGISHSFEHIEYSPYQAYLPPELIATVSLVDLETQWMKEEIISLLMQRTENERSTDHSFMSELETQFLQRRFPEEHVWSLYQLNYSDRLTGTDVLREIASTISEWKKRKQEYQGVSYDS